jgi:hypothetical protein
MNPISSAVMFRPCMTMPCAMVNTVEDHVIRVQQKKEKFSVAVGGGRDYFSIIGSAMVELPE